VVLDYDQLVARVRHIVEEFEQPALVEEYIDGREIHVALLGDGDPEVLPLFEMEFEDAPIAGDGRWRPHIISAAPRGPTTRLPRWTAFPATVDPALRPDRGSRWRRSG
jgi:D-alanine-D-alanine ligase